MTILYISKENPWTDELKFDFHFFPDEKTMFNNGEMSMEEFVSQFPQQQNTPFPQQMMAVTTTQQIHYTEDNNQIITDTMCYSPDTMAYSPDTTRRNQNQIASTGINYSGIETYTNSSCNFTTTTQNNNNNNGYSSFTTNQTTSTTSTHTNSNKEVNETDILQYLIAMEQHNTSTMPSTTISETCFTNVNERSRFQQSPQTTHQSFSTENTSPTFHHTETTNTPTFHSDSTNFSFSQSDSSDDDHETKKVKRLYKFNPKPLVSKPSMRRHRYTNTQAHQDPEYFERRRKNNEASRRSRLARRYKECLIVEEMEKLKKENEELKEQIQKLKEQQQSQNKL